MDLRFGAALLVLLATGCGIASPRLAASTPASGARVLPSTSASSARVVQPTATAGCTPTSGCPSELPVGGLAFDVDRETLVLFGGYNPRADGVLNETWEWTQARGWNQLHPATTPPARGMTAMTYDEARHVVLMYGGRETAGGTVPCGEFAQLFCSTDTWTWSGTDWTQLHPAKNPYPFEPTMTFDESVSAPLVYDTGAETWSWDGSTWDREASLSGRPTPHRYYPVMAFDPASEHVVMFGGFSQAGDVNTMWSWTGQSWTSLGIDAPLRVLQAAAVSDVDGHSLLGYQAPRVIPPIPPVSNVEPAQTWVWKGNGWTRLHPQHEPTASASGIFADPASHRVLLVGMNFAKGGAIEIWAWDGADWSQLV